MDSVQVKGTVLRDIQNGKFNVDTMLFLPRLMQQAGEINPEKDYDIVIKPHWKKRSLDSNSYFWEMVNKLSEVLDISPKELYQNYIKQGNVYRDWQLTQQQAPTFIHVWEQQGIGWVTEKLDYAENEDDVIIRAYYGSSSYNTKQMSRLIDKVVQDCKAVGIETRTPEEIASMLGEWKQNV